MMKARSAYAASSIRRRSAAWTILLDWMYRSRRRASASWMMRARSCGKRGWRVSLNSLGIEPPKLKAPANAADCHMHPYDPARFPMPPNPRAAPTNATVEDYRLLQKRIGTTRVVIVQPRNYATDNRVTLYAISQLGPNARGGAV